MKYTWTREDNIICSLAYYDKLTYKQAHLLLPHISYNSIVYKYKNCLYLDKGNVIGSLENCSKLHKIVWEVINNI